MEPPTDDPHHPELLRAILCEIEREGPLTFARFMELALHHPQYGYYAAGDRRLGRDGDFFTASDLSTHFGRCMARQLLEFDDCLGQPQPFTVIEHGGGRGLLARDILDGLADSRPVLTRLGYVLIDRSAGMRESARANVPEVEVLDRWRPGRSAVGAVLAVELFDALPVHRLRRRDGRLVEVGVDADGHGELCERVRTPHPAVAELAQRYGAAPQEGDEAEVCPQLDGVVEGMARGLDRGFLVVVDYGHSARRLYGPRHRRGTLLAYHRHRTNEDYLKRVGQQDLTAHVNFTALADALERNGFTVLGRTTQDRFLIANGVLEPFETTPDEEWSRVPRVRQRLEVRQLIHPLGMGRTFQVLIACRGLPTAPALRGLQDPFARVPGPE